MQIPVFVISLERATDRRTDIRARLEAAGFQYTIVDAVDGQNLSNYNYRADDRSHKFLRGRKVSNNEIGCYLSHYNLWQKMVTENIEVALIFEDDAKWDDDLVKVIDDIMALKEQWGMCLLTDDKNCRFFRKLHAVGKDRFLGYPLKRTMALTGYILKREAAANMSKQFAVVYEPVDMAIARHWEYDCMRFSVRPHPIRHDEENTTINDRGTELKGVKGKTLFGQILGGLLKTGEWMKRIYYYYACK